MIGEFKRAKREKGPFDIIGDIHGCLEELKKLLDLLGYKKDAKSYYHPEGRKLVSVGDLNDRGPFNLSTITLWMDIVENRRGYYVHGNHCNKFYRYLLGRKVQLTHGLDLTVKEYLALSQTKQEVFRNRYLRFYESSSTYLILDEGKLVVSHGGILERYIGRTDKKVHTFCLYGDITGQSDEAGHPIRKDWCKEYRGKSFIAYGHTPVREAIIIHNTVDLDTGCVFGGKLTALQYPEKKIFSINSLQRVEQEQIARMEVTLERLKQYVDD